MPITTPAEYDAALLEVQRFIQAPEDGDPGLFVALIEAIERYEDSLFGTG